MTDISRGDFYFTNVNEDSIHEYFYRGMEFTGSLMNNESQQRTMEVNRVTNLT